MGDYIRKYDIPTYSSLTTYDRYAVVKFASGAGEYYFVSIQDSNKGHLDTTSFTSNTWWQRFDDYNNDFATSWTPSFTTVASIEPRIVDATLDGGTTQLTRTGINNVPMAFQLVFENVSDAEAKSLLCFFDYQGTSRAFNWTTPAPYNQKLAFTLQSIRHVYTRKNINTVNIIIEQSFVIFGVGAGQQKSGAF